MSEPTSKRRHVNLHLPADLHLEARQEALRRGLSLRAYIEHVLREALGLPPPNGHA